MPDSTSGRCFRSAGSGKRQQADAKPPEADGPGSGAARPEHQAPAAQCIERGHRHQHHRDLRRLDAEIEPDKRDR